MPPVFSITSCPNRQNEVAIKETAGLGDEESERPSTLSGYSSAGDRSPITCFIHSSLQPSIVFPIHPSTYSLTHPSTHSRDIYCMEKCQFGFSSKSNEGGTHWWPWHKALSFVFQVFPRMAYWEVGKKSQNFYFYLFLILLKFLIWVLCFIMIIMY